MRKLIASIMTVVMCLSLWGTTPAIVYAAETTEETVSVEEDFVIEDGVLVSYTGTASKVVIPEGVTVIGENVFYCNENMKTLVIPEGVIEIKDMAFNLCWQMTSVSFPSTLTTIGYSAFASCVNLQSITIPESVTTIGMSAFSNCDSLVSVEIPGTVENLGAFAFEKCDSLKNITLLDGSTYVSEGMCTDCIQLNNVVIPTSVKSIDAYAFDGCTGLKEITIPASVEVIKNSAFNECEALQTVNLSEGLKTIETFAFFRCGSLSEVTIPKSVEKIEDYAFHAYDYKTQTYPPLSMILSVYENSYGYDYVMENKFSYKIAGIDAIIGGFGENNGYHWSYDAETKTLTVTGEDTEINSFNEATWCYESPFASLGLELEKIVFQNCVFNGSLEGLLYDLRELKEVEFINCDTSAVTNMSQMFYYCESLTSLDLSGFNTSNVTDMSRMFWGCKGLKELDVSSFNTTNVSEVEFMFSYCSSLTSLDVSGFDTSKITNFREMFNGCTNITSLDVSGFDTSNATNLQWMFKGCESLTSLDVSKFDTSKVTDMSDMFSGCRSLTSLNVSNFDTTNVEYMDSIFNDCRSLTSLDVSNFDTSKVRSLDKMFNTCTSLTSLDLSNFDTSNVQWMEYMFHGCESLTSLDVSSFDTSKVESYRWAFYGCSSLETLDLSSFDIISGANIISMLTDCGKIQILHTPKTIAEDISLELPDNLPGTPDNRFADENRNIYTNFTSAEDTVLYKVHKIIWYPGGAGNNAKNPDWFISLDDVIIPKDPLPLENYAFNGWYTDQNYKTKVTKIDPAKTKEDVVLYARWIPEAPAKPYKIVNTVSGVHVYWNPVGEFNKYGVWRSETGKNGTYKWIANPTATHFTDTKVESGKTYYYKITACQSRYSGDVHGEMSEAVGITYVGTPDITSRINKAAGIQLGWEKIKGATGYAIYRKSYSGNDAWVRIATISDPSKLSYVDTAVKNSNGKIYKYTIRALAGSDRKTLSGCRNAGRTMVRLSSRELTKAVNAGQNTIKCTWTTSSAVTGYEVRFMVGNKVEKIVTVGNYKIGSKAFTGLKAGKTYKVQVRSYKKVAGVGSFYSAWSTAKNVKL